MDCPNYFSDNFKDNKELMDALQKMVNKAFDSQPKSFVKNDHTDAKIIKIDKSTHLMMVKRNDVIQLVLNNYAETGPFNLYKKALQNNTPLYAAAFITLETKELQKINQVKNKMMDKIISFTESGTKVEDIIKDIQKDLAILGIAKEKIKKIFGKPKNEELERESQFMLTSSAHFIKYFFNIMKKNSFTNYQIKDEDLIKLNQDQICSFLENGNLDRIIIDIDYQTDIAKKSNFSEKKPYEWNSDNLIFMVNDLLVLRDQHAYFVIDKREDKLICYATDGEGGTHKKCEELKSLLKAIADKKTNLIDHVILDVTKEKVKFVDNAYLYSLDLNLDFGTQNLISEGHKRPRSPLDTTDYDYQRKYYAQKYGFNEFEFVAQAFFTLGGGFDFDKKSGRFVDDKIRYLDTVANFVEKPKDEYEFTYCGLDKLHLINDNLDTKWRAGLERTLEILKKDKPKPIVVNTREAGINVNNVTKILIERLENKLNKVNSKTEKIKKSGL